MTEDPAIPKISVRGMAHLEVEPEVARLSVQVQSRNADRAAALDQLVRRNRECLDMIRSYGEAVEKLETSGLTISPVMRGRHGHGDVRFYQGTVWTRIMMADFSAMGELVTRLGDMEGATVTGPSWELRPGSEVYRRAAREAAEDAVDKARGYADALGCRLTGLLELADEGLSARRHDRGMTLMAAGAAPGGEPEPIDLEPETQIVEATVVARFTATAPDLG